MQKSKNAIKSEGGYVVHHRKPFICDFHFYDKNIQVLRQEILKACWEGLTLPMSIFSVLIKIGSISSILNKFTVMFLLFRITNSNPIHIKNICEKV